MQLCRLFLNPTNRAVRFDIANPDGLHKSVMRLFPDGAGPAPRKTFSVLHRLDETSTGRLMLLVQSQSRPETRRLSPGYLLDLRDEPDLVAAGVTTNPSFRDVTEERKLIVAGQRFHFRLKANTTRKIASKSRQDGTRVNGKRVPLLEDGARLAWLRRKAAAAGFSIAATEVLEVRAQGREVRLAGVVFDGVLEVTDSTAFRVALEEGVGPAKAFGFGLLSIRRFRS
jgi:CRISPR system Cascade subunit CasE